MSWESSLLYYKIINEETKKRLWWLNSAEILMHSVNFKTIEELQHTWDWEKLTKIMIENAKKLEKWWADFIVICTNTMHMMAKDIEENTTIPLIHIANAAAKAVKNSSLKKVALLGTKFTMEEDFYKWRIKELYEIDVIIPNKEEREIIHNVIYQELVLWKINEISRNKYIGIINNLKERWAEWVILWCTEIWTLIKQSNSPLPIFDTTYIHAKSAVDKALA